MFQLHPTGILALAASVMCWSLAVVLFRVGTSGSVARMLALLLFIEGMTLISTGYVYALGTLFAVPLVASAIVVFFLAPLQRFAERVAGAAMQNTANTPEYVAYRKMQVYEAAVIEARQGDGIFGKERALLNRLREFLGISSADTDSLENGLPSPSS